MSGFPTASYNKTAQPIIHFRVLPVGDISILHGRPDGGYLASDVKAEDADLLRQKCYSIITRNRADRTRYHNSKVAASLFVSS